ncbi:MAG TPA: hypothetical protein VIF62_14020 [Labilithrix sp.]|jgi:hypothetical protein
MRRKLVTALGLSSVILVSISAVLFACSSDSPATPSDAGADTTRPLLPPPPPDEPFDAGTPDSGNCSVQPLTHQPSWHPPRPLHAGLCSPQQIEGYYESCYAGTTAECSAFQTQNPECFGCLEGSDTDPTRGAVVWFRNHTIFRLNLPGCYAWAFGDTSDAGCGAAVEEYFDCQDYACESCPVDTNAHINAALACEHDAGGSDICAPFKAAESTKCAGQFPIDGASPDVVHCRGDLTPDGPTLQKQYFTDFCGSADAGTD